MDKQQILNQLAHEYKLAKQKLKHMLSMDYENDLYDEFSDVQYANYEHYAIELEVQYEQLDNLESEITDVEINFDE